MATLPQTSFLIEPVARDWSITEDKVTKLVERLVQAYRPVRLVAFGSWARGQHTAESDLDLAIIVDDKRKDDLIRWDAADIDMASDHFVTALNTHRRQAFALATVHHAIATEGVVLYESSSAPDPFYIEPSPEEFLSLKIETMRALLAIVAKDEVVLNLEGAPHEIAGFHGQQSLEKLMKLWLVAYDIVPEHTHLLTKIKAKLRENGLELPELGVDIAKLSEYAVKWRYFELPEDQRVDIGQLCIDVATLREHVVQQCALMQIDLRA